MSGYPQHNLPAFEQAAADLRSKGIEIISPAEIDQEDISDFRETCLADKDGTHTNIGAGDIVNGFSWGDLLARDVKLIADECGGIILMENWEQSRGARLEAFVAVSCPTHRLFEYRKGELWPVDRGFVLDRINEELHP